MSDGNQFIYTLDGYACIPGQPLLKSMRLQSTRNDRSMNVCYIDDIDAPVVCRRIPLR